jgi:hypothetical protein
MVGFFLPDCAINRQRVTPTTNAGWLAGRGGSGWFSGRTHDSLGSELRGDAAAGEKIVLGGMAGGFWPAACRRPKAHPPDQNQKKTRPEEVGFNDTFGQGDRGTEETSADKAAPVHSVGTLPSSLAKHTSTFARKPMRFANGPAGAGPSSTLAAIRQS